MNTKYLYWGSTILVALLVAFSGTMYFVAEAPAETFRRLGYPEYFRVLLGIGKIVGAVLLIAPLPRWLKEWTYAGFTFDFSAAIISHAVVGDSVSTMIFPAVALAVLWTSYAGYYRYVLSPDEAVKA